MKIWLLLFLAVFIIHGVSSQRRYYVPDNRYQQPAGRYPSHRRSSYSGGNRRSLIDNGQSRDPFDPTYPLGVYPIAKTSQYAGYGMVQSQRVPLSLDYAAAGYQQQAGLAPYDIDQQAGLENNDIDRKGWQESAYPSFQGFEDAYPAFNPHMQTVEGHPYHSQQIRIKHSFPANQNVKAPSPQVNQYVSDFSDTPRLNQMLPGFGGAGGGRATNHGVNFGRLGGLGSGSQLNRLLPQYNQLNQYNYNALLPQRNKLLNQRIDSPLNTVPQMSKLMPQYDAMDPRMMQYAKNPNTIVVEKKVPVPYKVQIEKPYFVEVTKHVAVPVAVPVPKPMPYPVHKYIQIPKYIQVPQQDTSGGSTTAAPLSSPIHSSPHPFHLSSPSPHYFPSSLTSLHFPSTPSPHYYGHHSHDHHSEQTHLDYSHEFDSSPHSDYHNSSPQFEYPFYTPDHEPQVSIHPHGVSPRPTPLELLEKKSRRGGSLSLDELQELMNSEKMPDEPYIFKK